MNCCAHMAEIRVVEQTISTRDGFPGINMATGKPALGVIVILATKIECCCCGAVELRRDERLFNFDLPVPPPPPTEWLIRELIRRLKAKFRRRA